MNHPSTDDVNKALAGLQAAISGVKSALLVSSDGSVLGSTSSAAIERAQLSGVSAASFAIGRKAARNMNLGDLNRVHMRCQSGSVLLVTVGERAILALVLTDGTAPDALLVSARNALHQIESLL